MLGRWTILIGGAIAAWSAVTAVGQAIPFEVHDHRPTPAADPSAVEPEAGRSMGGAAAGALEVLSWEAESFTATLELVADRDYPAEVCYPSPMPDLDAGLNRVRLRWYPALRSAGPVAAGQTADPAPPAGAGMGPDDAAPAVLLVHSLHPDLPVATMLARGLSGRGVHAFVLEMPGYASRAATPPQMTGVTTLLRAAQAVTDVRRGHDVIAALARQPAADATLRPIDPQRIAVQGTSLGSFVAATASAIDGRFSQTFLLLSGGDGLDILRHGQKDAFHVRNALRHYGYDDAALAELIQPIEPLAIADRLDPSTTWMFNAVDDVVIPRPNAERLADAIGLEPSHRVWMPGNHYTAFLLLPGVLERMCEALNPSPATAE